MPEYFSVNRGVGKPASRKAYQTVLLFFTVSPFSNSVPAAAPQLLTFQNRAPYIIVGKAITPYETRLPQLEVWADGLLTGRLTNESFLFRLE